MPSTPPSPRSSSDVSPMASRAHGVLTVIGSRAGVLALLTVVAAGAPLLGEAAAGPVWRPLDTGSAASLRGLAALDDRVAWATGSDGTVLRTRDGGGSWERLTVGGGEALDFRDIEAFDADTALLMSAGQPARIYRTEDGGRSFALVHESPSPAAFFDGLAFWDEKHGLAFSDPVDGAFLVLKTDDGGRSWSRLDAASLPRPLDGEAGFAASGSNVVTGRGGRAWIGTGGAVARVLVSTDHGRSWRAVATPLRSGAPSAGVFSIAFRDARHGVAAGGDYQDPAAAERTLAWSDDGGESWTAAAVPPPSGHRASVAFIRGRGTPTWIAVGRNGSDLSTDDGRHWRRFSSEGYYVLSVGRDGSVWAAGADGRVGKLRWGGGGRLVSTLHPARAPWRP